MKSIKQKLCSRKLWLAVAGFVCAVGSLFGLPTSEAAQITSVITAGGVLNQRTINSFKEGALLRWKTEIIARILPEMRNVVRKAHLIESNFRTDQDSYMWNKIKDLREYLAKDAIDKKSLFTRLTNALNSGDFATASKLQVETYNKIEELKQLYDEYVRNNI